MCLLKRKGESEKEREEIIICAADKRPANYNVTYISYRVTGLYRLGKTCYLHSLLCNNSIICIVYCAIIVLLHSIIDIISICNDIISICIWENDNTANSLATSNTWLVTCHCLRRNLGTRTPHDKTVVGVANHFYLVANIVT